MNSQIVHLNRIDSTSKYLKRNIRKYDNFTFVYADEQSEGKGRGDHEWKSEAKKNLLISYIIKDKTIINNFNYLSILCGLVIAKILTNYGIKNISLKWPNDVYVNDKKIAGILLEGSVPTYIIVGVGINVNQVDFNGLNATSIKLETKKNRNIDVVLSDFIKETLNELSNIDKEKIISEYNKLDYLKDKTIRFNYFGEQKEGIAKGINLDCSLKVISNNKTISLNADEVTLTR